MPRFFIGSMVALFLAVPTLRADDKKPEAGKDTHETLAQETLKNIKETTKILKDVQNKEHVEKAKKDLAPILERIADVRKRYVAVGQPTKEQDAELEKKFKGEMEDAVKAFTTEFQRLVKADYAKDLVAFIQQKPKDGK